MKISNDLRDLLRSIDYKGYPAYKSLAGSYQFGNFILFIDHVQRAHGAQNPECRRFTPV